MPDVGIQISADIGIYAREISNSQNINKRYKKKYDKLFLI